MLSPKAAQVVLNESDEKEEVEGRRLRSRLDSAGQESAEEREEEGGSSCSSETSTCTLLEGRRREPAHRRRNRRRVKKQQQVKTEMLKTFLELARRLVRLLKGRMSV